MATQAFEDLPMEIIVVIFNHLNIQDLQQCCQTCTKWKNIIVQFFFRPQLRTLAMVGLQCHMPDHSELSSVKKLAKGRNLFIFMKLFDFGLGNHLSTAYLLKFFLLY